jgi:GGDEF domain-containing protein
VTVSVGASVCHAGTNGIDALLKQADIALYEAKHAGRDCVCRFEPHVEPESATTSFHAP